MADESIRRLERALELDPHDRDTRLALGAAKFRIGTQPQDDPDVAFWWIVEKKIPKDRIRMAARLGYGPAKLIATGPELDWAKLDGRKMAISILTRREMVFLAADFADACLSMFESEHPDDSRPRIAIESGRNWAKDPTESNREVARASAVGLTYAHWAADVAWAASCTDTDVSVAADAAYVASYVIVEVAKRAAAKSSAIAIRYTAAAVARQVSRYAFAAHPEIANTQRLRCIHYLLKFPNVPEIL